VCADDPRATRQADNLVTDAEKHIQPPGKAVALFTFAPEFVGHGQSDAVLGFDARPAPGQPCPAAQVRQLNQQGAGLIGVAVIAMIETAQVGQIVGGEQGKPCGLWRFAVIGQPQ